MKTENTAEMQMEKSAKGHIWPDEVRLKMIEKSDFYLGKEQIYQFGYYDGFQKAIDMIRNNQIDILTCYSKPNN